VIRRSLLLVVVLVMVVAACSSDSSSDEQDGFPTGTFAGEHSPVHLFVFSEDGTYTYTESDFVGDQDVTGVYGVRGDLYTEMTHDYAGYSQVPATYRWEFDGERLTFELVGKDVIPSRQLAYTNQTYIKEE
jgi:hypothetical protein